MFRGKGLSAVVLCWVIAWIGIGAFAAEVTSLKMFTAAGGGDPADVSVVRATDDNMTFDDLNISAPVLLTELAAGGSSRGPFLLPVPTVPDPGHYLQLQVRFYASVTDLYTDAGTHFTGLVSEMNDGGTAAVTAGRPVLIIDSDVSTSNIMVQDGLAYHEIHVSGVQYSAHGRHLFVYTPSLYRMRDAPLIRYRYLDGTAATAWQ